MCRHVNICFTIPLCVVILFSCKNNLLFQGNHEISKNIWNAGDTIIFRVPVYDTTESYEINIFLRNSSGYPFSNIFLFITTVSPLRAQITDTVEYMLTDAGGKWFGSGWGGLKNNILPYRKNIRFPVKGIYSFRIVQAMREEQLSGIFDIGLEIKPFVPEKEIELY